MKSRGWTVLVLLVVNCERVPAGDRTAPSASSSLGRDRIARGDGDVSLRASNVAPNGANVDALEEATENILSTKDKAALKELASEAVGCRVEPPAPQDLYRALVRGSDSDRAGAALKVLKTRRQQARTVVQRAISVVAAQPECAQLHPLTSTLLDTTMDDITRQQAALALGMIARDFPCTFPTGACPRPHDPIPSWSKRALIECATGKRIALARACVEALGYVAGENATLISLRDDTTKDPMLRFFAGRALTRVTQTQQVTSGSLKDLVDSATEMAR